MANIKFKFDNGNLKRNVRDIPDSINNGINAVMDRAAVSGEAEMKTNAPWTDRTGAARNGLHTQPFLGDKRHKEIVFAHSVEYGIWLETIESGQYAIILKSMRITGYKMMNNLRYLLDRTKF